MNKLYNDYHLPADIYMTQRVKVMFSLHGKAPAVIIIAAKTNFKLVP